MIKTTIYLPDDLYEKLRLQAFNERTSINKLILAQMGVADAPEVSEEYRKEIKQVENRVVQESHKRQQAPNIEDIK